MGSYLKVYAVFDAKSGDLVASGTAEQCADQMGITIGSFWTFRHRSSNGHGTYHIESVELKDSSLQDAIKLWDDSFSWLRERKKPENPYPCDGCMLRSICEFQDGFCEKWERWYQTEHERVSELLNTEAKRIVR